MIHVELRFPPDVNGEEWYQKWLASEGLADDWFEKWKTFRDKQAEKLDRTKPNSEVWSRLKDYLFALFHNKCGYCESSVTHVYYGDVDHYRPKSSYAWLAYDETNYVPACNLCNSAGKGSTFTVVGGTRATAPGEESKERPLLLNPYEQHDLSKHLFFVVAGEAKDPPGAARGLTPEGRETIRICNLNRDPLITRRERQQHDALRDFQVSLFQAGLSAEAIRSEKERACATDLEYSAARRNAVESWLVVVAKAA